MVINYTVQAEVVDITADTPKSEDLFFVDTNVWYWLTYSRASLSARPPSHYQTSNYPNYTSTALGAGARIFHSGLSMAELTHLVEKAEYEIFAKANPAIFPETNRFDKSFRHERIHERSKTVSEIEAVWAQVTSLAEPLTVTIDAPTASAALSRLKTEKIDGYDLFILEAMNKNGITQVITDDGDFTTVSGIQVFTANRNVVRAARAQGKLAKR